MKLIHVFSAPQSAYYFMNGQLDYMASNGVEVTVIMPADSEFNTKFKEKQFNVNIVNINFERNISIKTDLYCLFQLISAFRKLKPDIIHLHTPKASLLGGLAARFLRKKHIVFQMHGLVSALGNSVQKGLIYSMEKLTCMLSTQIFAVSESIKEFAIQHNFCNRNKIFVIEKGTINGIDFNNQFNPIKHKRTNTEYHNLCYGKFVIGFVGRLSKDKGIYDYIEILFKCKEKNLQVIGFVIGPDESQGELAILLKKYNLVQNKDIYLFGQQLEPESFMIHFDILLLPTKREGFGLVGSEANALEIPVVGYNIPGFRDSVLNNKTGLLVDFENTDKLLEAVLIYYKDPILKKKHGKYGRKRVIRDFDQKLIWESLYKQYRTLLTN